MPRPSLSSPRTAAFLNALTVGRPDSSKSLLDYLAPRLGLSRRAAKAIIDGRSVWVNRRCVWIAHHALKTGDLVEVPKGLSGLKGVKSPKDSKGAPGAKAHIRVLVELKDFVVADKPAGLLSNGGAGSVEAILREQLGEPNLQAVHRLDRDTSGCLLFARSYAAYLAAVEVFKTHRVRKEYRAIVVGKFPYVHQRIDAPLVGVLAVMERNGAPIDAGKLAEIGAATQSEIDALKETIYELAACAANCNVIICSAKVFCYTVLI